MASIRWEIIAGNKSVQETKPQPTRPQANAPDGLDPFRGLAIVLKFYFVLVGAAIAVYLFFLMLRRLPI